VKKRAVHHVATPLGITRSLDALRSVFPPRRGGFLLDGGEHALFGAEPWLSFRARRTRERSALGRLCAEVSVEAHGSRVRTSVADPFVMLGELLREHAVDPSTYAAAPLPLRAGAVGYVGYEAGQMLERLPADLRTGEGLPDIALFFHDWVIARSRTTGATWLSVLGRGDTEDEARAESERTRVRIAGLAREAFAGDIRERASDGASGSDLASDAALLAAAGAVETVARDAYLAKVRTAKEHIAAGDAFEICLTHRIDAPFDGDAFALFQELRRANGAPYAAFLDLPEAAIVSSSPERFLALGPDRIAESRPIKGTRRRAANREEDERLAADLRASTKDRAENAMIVDLVRNDLGRVCRYGSVVVPDLYAVESYATVHQLVSTVRGELAPGREGVDLLRACFPPGSMTGAPKIEAMTILERLEPTERGVYAGALGWFDFAGTLDLSVVIRTIVVIAGRAYLHVGGAVVSDSDPADEHDESLVKARALLAALARAEAGSRPTSSRSPELATEASS